MFNRVVLFTAILLALLHCTAAISQISAVGSKFFTSEGTQFYIKGIAYQLTDQDPLIDTNQCKLDASLMQKLGANTIRVYHVDPTGDHQGCMDAFADAGIYLFVDLDTFDTQIEEDQPAWNQTQVNRFTAVLDEFQKYDGTAGVFVGNEVLSFANASDVAPYVKAAIRDIKAYRNSKKYRNIPVGYSAADIPELRPMLQNYLACGDDDADRADFFSLNAYEWCGSASNYVQSGYSMLQQNASDYNIPIFLSETGCIKPKPRLFEDQTAIFGKVMDGTWSGAIIYEWIEEANDYGLVEYGPTVNPATATATDAPDGFPRSGTPTPVSPDFSNLQNQWATLTPTGVALSDYSASASSITPVACPTSTPNGWVVNGDVPLPTIGQTLNRAAASATGTATGSAAKPTSTKKGSASGGKEVVGMSFGLAGVMLGFIWWL